MLTEKQSGIDLHNYVSIRHTERKGQYHGVCFELPLHYDVDDVMVTAGVLIVKGTKLMIPKALPHPSTCPIKETSKRKNVGMKEVLLRSGAELPPVPFVTRKDILVKISPKDKYSTKRSP